MIIKTIYRTEVGKVELVEIDRNLELGPDDVLVRGRICGFCKSDIETIFGKNKVSVEIFGHEGVGVVSDVGRKVRNFSAGDPVATYGDGCYGDYYKVGQDNLVRINLISPNFIVQPLATMYNVLLSFKSFKTGCAPILINGCGSNALLLAKIFCINGIDFDFMGSHNLNEMFELGGKRIIEPKKNYYGCVIEISGKQGAYSEMIHLLCDGGCLVGAANPEEPETLDLFTFSWKAITMIFPSPRSLLFRCAFQSSAELLNSGVLNLDNVFTKGYDRNDPLQLQQAVEDKLSHRVIKGYLYWNL
jgi:threonine dehydrogenase-like Zn-dependent dehydrogenase